MPRSNERVSVADRKLLLAWFESHCNNPLPDRLQRLSPNAKMDEIDRAIPTYRVRPDVIPGARVRTDHGTPAVVVVRIDNAVILRATRTSDHCRRGEHFTWELFQLRTGRAKR